MTPMRCAAYARYSSDLQRETSIDDQITVARTYAERHGWTVIDQHIYSDAGITGASLEGRPGIQALLKAAATAPPPFEVLLVDDTSRFARDTADAIRAVQQLTFCGVRIIFISQGLDTASEQAETLVAVHGVVDQLYIRELKHKIKRGLRGQLDRGFHTGSKTYGYRSVKVFDPSGRRDGNGPVVIGKRREVDPGQALVVQQIYQWYVDGLSLPKIVDRLNRTGVPTSCDTPWNKHRLERILRNERYLGRQIWGQTTFKRRPGTNKVVPRTLPRDEWHVAERPELRIVDDELWHAAQARRESLRTTYNIPFGSNGGRGRKGLYSPHLLVGLTRCGTCGGAISIVAGGSGSPRYGCPRSWHDGIDACDNRMTIMSKVVDPLILKALQDELLRPEWVDEITKAVTNDVQARLNQEPARRVALSSQRAAVARKLDSLLAAAEDGIPFASLKARIGEPEAEIRQIDEELAGLGEQSTVDRRVFPTWVQQQLTDLAGLLHDAPQRAKAELKRLDVCFTLHPIRDEGKPFLRAEGTGDLDALCRTRDLPSTARSRAQMPESPHLSIGSRSLLRSGSERDKRPAPSPSPGVP